MCGKFTDNTNSISDNILTSIWNNSYPSDKPIDTMVTLSREWPLYPMTWAMTR